jgi:hypothetical protein
MSDRTGVVKRYNSLRKDLGRSALSAFFPNDIEYYLCAFELVSSQGIESYFVFPIQPSSINKSEPTRTNIKKSLSGVTVLRNSSFVPQELSLKGNFGKRFKILAGLEGIAFTRPGVSLSRNTGLSVGSPEFSASVKTGYGAMKLMQKLLQDSNSVDNRGKPKRLYFYNMALGESYLVVVPPSGYSFSQTEDSNTIWMYSVNMTILAPLSAVANVDVDSSSLNLVSKGAIQKGANTVVNDIKLFLQ